MLDYRANIDFAVAVKGLNEFYLDFDEGACYNAITRETLLKIRFIIDQALNTSAEELGDA